MLGYSLPNICLNGPTCGAGCPLAASKLPGPRLDSFLEACGPFSVGRRVPGSLWPGCDGRSVLRSRPSSCAPCSRGRESCVPERSNYSRRGRSRSYIRGSLTKLIISSLKPLVSLAAGGSAPGPPTYFILSHSRRWLRTSLRSALSHHSRVPQGHRDNPKLVSYHTAYVEPFLDDGLRIRTFLHQNLMGLLRRSR